MAAADRLDLRLLGPAVGAWLATLACLGFGSGASAGTGDVRVAVVLVAGALLGAVLAVARRRRWSAAVVLVLLGVLAAACCTGLRVHARDSGPVAELARQRAIAAVTLVVTDDPHPVGTASAGGQTYLIAGRLLRADSGGRTVAGRAALIVLTRDARWAQLLPSQRVSTHGRLEPADGGDLTVAVLAARGPPALQGQPSTLQRAAGRLRSGLRTACRGLPAGARGLLPGLVVGDTSQMDPDLTADFRTTGLTHLVAVSGTNCAIVAGAVLLLLRRLRAGPRVSAVAAALALGGFVVLVRPSPSVLRAAVMGGIALVALASGRTRSALPALAASVVGLLLYDPALARSAGFALSVLATAGLLLVAPTWRDALRRRHLPRGVAESLALPAAAQVACAPVLAVLSAQVSLVSVPANLLAAPAVAPATILGVAAALVSPVSPGLAALLARLGGFFASWLVAVAEHGAKVPAGVLPWPGGRSGGLLLAGVLVLGAIVLRRGAVRRTVAVAAATVLVMVAVAHAVPVGWPPDGWVLVACDVGQGDGLALSAGPGSAVVVDSGTDPTAMDQCLRALHVRAVPLVVLTHFHADHVGGLAGVLRGRRVGAVLTDSFHEPTVGWSLVQRVTANAHVPLQQTYVGEQLVVGQLTLSVLGPVQEIRGSRSDPNNNSVILRVRVRGRTILMTGDADVEEEQSLERAGTDLRADVLKEPHHGSSYVDPAFLAATHASVSIISVGADNDYGQPAQRALSWLRADGMQVLRTDQSGDVAVAVHGGSLTWSAKHTHSPPKAIGGTSALGRPSDQRTPIPPAGEDAQTSLDRGGAGGRHAGAGGVGSGTGTSPARTGRRSMSASRATIVLCWRPWCSCSVRSSCSSIGRSTRRWVARAPPTRTSRCTGWMRSSPWRSSATCSVRRYSADPGW